ncbi:CoA activase [bacterium]|nr:CoA activase [bacterium]
MFIGIDIGSTCAKTVVLDKDKNLIFKFVQPTGFSSVDTADLIKEKLIENGIEFDENHIFATGYGRISVPYAKKRITEITCHAKGAVHLFNDENMILLDIGGQDTKVISIENGQVKDFLMNDKCSAGTGRFLEVMANSLALCPIELCDLASKGGGVKISSMCTVFAESEVISLVAKGEKKENIAFAVVDSISDKAVTLCRKLFNDSRKVYLTGGLCNCSFLLKRIGEKLNTKVSSSSEAQFAGAFGASLLCLEQST